MNDDLAHALTQQLDALGLRLHPQGALADADAAARIPAELTHGTSSLSLDVAYVPSMTFQELRQTSRAPLTPEQLLIVGERVTERSAEQFRRWGLNYIDSAGNAYVQFEGIHIDVRGRRSSPSRTDRSSRAPRGSTNLFSTKRAQVIFALLAWDDVLESTFREIAETADVAVGQAKQTIDLLEDHQYLLPRRRFAPGGRDILLAQWVAAYPTGLGAPSRGFGFRGEFAELHPTSLEVHVSGEAAVPDLIRRPTTFTFYADQVPSELVLARRWRSEDESPNIFYRQKFWTRPGDEPGLHTAPQLLVYADLLASGESRQREAAEAMEEGLHVRR